LGAETTDGLTVPLLHASSSLLVSNLSIFFNFSQPLKSDYLFTHKPAVLAIGLPFAPESPWYLVRKGRIDQARKVLSSLYSNPTEVADKLAAIE
jgi:hypothetical protein